MDNANREQVSHQVGTRSMNGNTIIKLRICLSSVISLSTIICAGVLIYTGHDIPVMWWTIAIIAVGGVAGGDILTNYLSRGKPDGQQH